MNWKNCRASWTPTSALPQNHWELTALPPRRLTIILKLLCVNFVLICHCILNLLTRFSLFHCYLSAVTIFYMQVYFMFEFTIFFWVPNTRGSQWRELEFFPRFNTQLVRKFYQQVFYLLHLKVVLKSTSYSRYITKFISVLPTI